MEEEQVKKFPTLGDYILLKTLGKGYNSKVKLGYHKVSGQHYALKIIHAQNYLRNLKTIKNEVEIMLKLKHDNILNLFEYKENDEYVKRNGEKRNVMFIALELAEGGELFEYVSNCGAFSEDVARTYYHQLIEGLSYCHSQQITHRDIKPENLLFDKNFVLKIADFGFSTLLSGRDGSGYNRTILGTESLFQLFYNLQIRYMAPEIHARQPYKGQQVDLFASAIILFIMYAGTPPFTQATPRDAYYKLIATNKLETFWASHNRYKPQGYFSEDFKDFINKMLAYYPNSRINVDQIKQHPWYQGKIIPQEQIIQEFTNRKQIIDIELEKERLEKLRQREQQNEQQQQSQQQSQQSQAFIFTGTRGFRGLGEMKEFEGIENNFSNYKSKRMFFQSSKADKKLQNFYTVIDGEYLWNYVLQILNTFQPKLESIKLNDNKYKIECSVGGELQSMEMEIKLVQMEEDVMGVEFSKKKGETCQFYDIAKSIKQKLEELREVKKVKN